MQSSPHSHQRQRRVGITGTRAIASKADRSPIATDQIRSFLQQLRERDAVSEQRVLVSLLAEGADRLAAHVALALGYRLEVVLPLDQADYERDFVRADRPAAENAASLAEFRGLLGQADRIEAPTPNPPRPGTLRNRPLAYQRDRPLAYQIAGYRMLDMCAVLLAVWDGTPWRGPGGTADIVGAALARGRPVWCVDPTGAVPPRWIAPPATATTPSQP